MARTAAALVLIGGFLVAMYYATLREAAISCEVCMDFGGQSLCRIATGVDRDRALYAARTNACAVLANGVTEGMQCGRAMATSAKCTEGASD